MNAKNELQRLKAENPPRASWKDILSVNSGSLTGEDEKALNDYFSNFLVPNDGLCVCCGARQGARNVAEAFLGSHFVWGIAHGEGYCSRCKWPARAYHYDIGPIKSLDVILQYHPAVLGPPEDEANREPSDSETSEGTEQVNTNEPLAERSK